MFFVFKINRTEVSYRHGQESDGIFYKYKLDYRGSETRVEAGSNTSTVNLRVVRGDETGLKEAAP
jgi:hypothetical protein